MTYHSDGLQRAPARLTARLFYAACVTGWLASSLMPLRAQSATLTELSPPRQPAAIELSPPRPVTFAPVSIPAPELVLPKSVQPIRPPARANSQVVPPPSRAAVSSLVPPLHGPSAAEVSTAAPPLPPPAAAPSSVVSMLAPVPAPSANENPSFRMPQALVPPPAPRITASSTSAPMFNAPMQSVPSPTAPQPMMARTNSPESIVPPSARRTVNGDTLPEQITIESPTVPQITLRSAGASPRTDANSTARIEPWPEPTSGIANSSESAGLSAPSVRQPATIYQPQIVEVSQPQRVPPQSQEQIRPKQELARSDTTSSRQLQPPPLRVAQLPPSFSTQPSPLSIDQIPASQFPTLAPTPPINLAPQASVSTNNGSTSTTGPATTNRSGATRVDAPIMESPLADAPRQYAAAPDAPQPYASTPETTEGYSPRSHRGVAIEIAGAGGMQEPMWQFNFQNAPWSVVIRNFARQNGMALQMLQEPTGSFTFVDDRPYTASEALDLLNDYLLTDGYLLVRNNQKLTTISAGAQVQEGIVPFIALRQIDSLGRNELASVAIPIKSNDAPRIMAEIQPLLSRLGRAQVVSNSSRLIVTDTGAYLRRTRDILGGYGLAAGDVQTTVFHLRNTTAESMAVTISQHLGGANMPNGDAGAGGAVQQASFSQPISAGRVIPDKETNSLVISGTPTEVAEIQSLICELDQARAQVVLQGLILEVNLGNVRELGAEIGLQDSVLFNRSVVDNLVTLQQTNTAVNGVQTTNQQVVSQTSAPGFNFNGQPLGNNTAVSPNVLGTQGLANLGVGRTNAALGFGGLVLSAGSNSVNLLLRALQANYEVDVLSRPQIRTIDDKEAFIQIGQQVPVVDGVTVTAVGTANPIIRQDQAGIILKMTPHVSPDGLIQIKVIAEKSAFKLAPGTGVPIFTDARNGTVIQAPIKDITTAQATVSARAGQTIVLGGMITRDDETIERRVPGLSRIPLLGRLFRYDYNNVTRKELLIFLTPQIITDDETSDRMKDTEIGRLHAPLERAAEIHGNLISGPREEIVREEIIRDAVISDGITDGNAIVSEQMTGDSNSSAGLPRESVSSAPGGRSMVAPTPAPARP